MDLTSQPILNVGYTIDEDTGYLTVTIKDDSDVELGTITIENSKYRSLMKALELMAHERVSSLEYQAKYKVSYGVNSNEGSITFG